MITAEDLYVEDDFNQSDGEVIDEAPPEENTELGPENEDESEENANKNPVKPKRIVKNPQPKLNAETLKGKRGLTALESYFERVNYKGQGHEEEDLSVILKTYEYWCHRLFPKYPFDACLAKIEDLGKKRAVLTHVKRIRADLTLEDTPIISNDDNDNDPVNDEIQVDNFDNLFQIDDQPQQPSSYDNLFDVNHQSQEAPVQLDEEQIQRIKLNKERAERIRKEKQQQRSELLALQTLDESQNFSSSVSGTSIVGVPESSQTSTEINKELLERIRLNREKAEKRRMERLKERMELTSSQESSLSKNSRESTSTHNSFQEANGTESSQNLESVGQAETGSHESSEQVSVITNQTNDDNNSVV